MKNVIPLCVATMLAAVASVTAASPPGPNYQGLWYNAPAESEAGWGINFAHQGDVVFASWFTYDTARKGWWLVMTANSTGGNTFSGALFEATGPAFDAVPFPPLGSPGGIVGSSVGTGTLTFTDANNGIFAYTANGVSQTKAITRQAFGPLPTCVFSASNNLATAANYTALWWAAPAGSESGWGINFTHQGNTIFASWFTFDHDHTPMWLVVTANSSAPGSYTGTLFRLAGPPFNAVPFPPIGSPGGAMGTAVGAASFTFSDGNNAQFAYTVNGVSQTKAITRQVFSPPGTVCEAASSGAEGFWSGTTSDSRTVRAIILDDGTYYILYSNSGNRSDAGVVQGSSSAANGNLASFDGVDFPIANALETDDSQVSAAVSGTYAPHSSLQLTIVEVSGTRTIAASYDAGYEHPANLAAAAGTYTGVSGHISGARPATFTLNSNGSLVGHNDVCTFNGTVTPRKSVNVFDWTLMGNNCIFPRAGVSGVLYYDEANRQIHGFAPFAGRTDQYYLIGTK